MNRISSILTIPYKIFLMLCSLIVGILSLIFFSSNKYFVGIVLLIITLLIFRLALILKSIYIKGDSVFIKGISGKKKIPKNDIIKVDDIFLFFYIQTENKKKYFFLSTYKDELKALFISDKMTKDSILSKIKE